MKNRKTSKQDQLMFLDESVLYKTGIDKDEGNTLLSHVNQEAKERQRIREIEERQERILREQQRKQEEQQRLKQEQRDETIRKIEDAKQKVLETGKQVKQHEIAFTSINKNFKIVLAISILGFLVNCVLSFIGGVIFWGNFFNLLGAIVIYFAMRHLSLSEETSSRARQITQILKQNMSQVIGDYITYKVPDSIKDKSEDIVKITTIAATIAFIILSSHNILYAAAVIISVLSILLLIGMKKFAELNAHLQLLNRAALIGVAVKALIMVIGGKFIQIEYMNVALLFLFTYIQFYFKEDTSLE